jgi:SAM-dependent methyltransferase
MHGTEAPSPWIQRWSHLLAPGCTALDIACGGGRHMQWLAAQGHAVLGLDRSAEALALAQTHGQTLQADIENGPWPLAGQTFGGVVVTNYLWRALWPQITASVAPGGVLLYETFAQGNETRTGELLEVCADAGLRVVAYEDGFLTTPERFVQRVAAVRPAAGQDPARWPLT